MLHGLRDRELRVVVVFLHEQADRQVVVGFVVVVAQAHGLLVVVDRLVVDADGEVGVGQVLVQLLGLVELQALLQDHDRLRVASQDVEGHGLVVVDVQGELGAVGRMGQLLQDLVADVQAVLRPVHFQVQVGEVLGGREIVLGVFQRRLEKGDGLLALQVDRLYEQGQRVFLSLGELHDVFATFDLLGGNLEGQGPWTLGLTALRELLGPEAILEEGRVDFLDFALLDGALDGDDDGLLSHLLGLFEDPLPGFRPRQDRVREQVQLVFSVVQGLAGLVAALLAHLVGLLLGQLEVDVVALVLLLHHVDQLLLLLVDFVLLLLEDPFPGTAFEVLVAQFRFEVHLQLRHHFFLLLLLLQLVHLDELLVQRVQPRPMPLFILLSPLFLPFPFLPLPLPFLPLPFLLLQSFRTPLRRFLLILAFHRDLLLIADRLELALLLFPIQSPLVEGLLPVFLFRMAHRSWRVMLLTVRAVFDLLRDVLGKLVDLVGEGAVVVEGDGFADVLDHPLQTPDAPLDGVDELDVLLDPFGVDGLLALREFLFGDPLESFVEVPEVLLLDFLVVLLLEALVGGEDVVLGEEGVADLVDDVHARGVDEGGELVLDQIEVVEDRLLKGPALGLGRRVDVVLFDQRHELILLHEAGRTHVVVVLLDARPAPARLFPHAALGRAEGCYFLAVLTF